MSNTIHLPSNRKWFNMILSGEKKEEYKDISPYWVSRLLDTQCIDKRYFHLSPRQGKYDLKPGKTTVTLASGYSPASPRIVVELTGLEIKHPNPAWCPPETEGLRFALKLGKVLETNNLTE